MNKLIKELKNKWLKNYNYGTFWSKPKDFHSIQKMKITIITNIIVKLMSTQWQKELGS